ncbi:MAG TPA: hypothetical protein VI488_22225, partial [Candidatus Angelobacter sp.]
MASTRFAATTTGKVGSSTIASVSSVYSSGGAALGSTRLAAAICSVGSPSSANPGGTAASRLTTAPASSSAAVLAYTHFGAAVSSVGS